MAIAFKDGMKLELWVWDRGELEGFAVYLNGELLDEQSSAGMKYPIDMPSGPRAIIVHFAGDDGGATKIIDIAAGGAVLEHQESGTKHSYLIVRDGEASAHA